MLTIRMNAARCEAVVTENDRVAARVQFDPAREDHRMGVCEMVENRLRQREREDARARSLPTLPKET